MTEEIDPNKMRGFDLARYRVDIEYQSKYRDLRSLEQAGVISFPDKRPKSSFQDKIKAGMRRCGDDIPEWW